jgi:hypothetical protein
MDKMEILLSLAGIGILVSVCIYTLEQILAELRKIRRNMEK